MKYNKNTHNTIDKLTEMQTKLTQLQSDANHAINIVVNTINSLEFTNQEIDETVVEIDDYISKLSTTRSCLDKNRKYNTAIIANFSKLLEVSEEE